MPHPRKFNDSQERLEELEDSAEELKKSSEIEKNKNKNIVYTDLENDELCKNVNHKRTIIQQKDELHKMELLLDEYKERVGHFQTEFEQQQDLTKQMRRKYESLNVQFQQQSQRLKISQQKIKTVVLWFPMRLFIRLILVCLCPI